MNLIIILSLGCWLASDLLTRGLLWQDWMWVVGFLIISVVNTAYSAPHYFFKRPVGLLWGLFLIIKIIFGWLIFSKISWLPLILVIVISQVFDSFYMTGYERLLEKSQKKSTSSDRD
jgi:CHASE2 domain-containing sensor protein